MTDFFQNTILLCACTSWLVAQLMKILVEWRLHRTISFRILFRNGGMPSSHTSFTIALLIMVAAREGLSTSAFAISFVLTAIVITDALGVRYQTGKQSRIINRILHQMLVEGKPLSDDTLQELVGHTPTEVFVGALIGVLTSLFFI